MMATVLDDFYYTGSAFKPGCMRVGPIENFDHFALARAEWTPPGILHFKHDAGTKPCDFIDTGFASLYLVSQRVVDLLGEHGLTGWRTFKVSVTDRQKRKAPFIHGFQVHGRCGPIDTSKSPRFVELGVNRVSKFLMQRGWVFDLDTWDGSDIFVPERMDEKICGHYFVTQRLKDIFEKAKVSNVSFKRITEFAVTLHKIE